ncbi:MAG: hypothetical protein Q8J89_06925 [Caulobacter sp.]|nr:hypothetical protein [Caulobacter sp.]
MKPLQTRRLPLAAALALTIAALAFAVGGLWPDGSRGGQIAAAPPHAAGAFGGVAAPRLR